MDNTVLLTKEEIEAFNNKSKLKPQYYEDIPHLLLPVVTDEQENRMAAADRGIQRGRNRGGGGSGDGGGAGNGGRGDSRTDWRATNPGYQPSPARVLSNGWVEVDGGRYADACRDFGHRPVKVIK